MLCFPNCKINLGLHVTRKRDDGYHDIETVFYPVPVTDVLEVVPAVSGRSAMHLSGLPVAGSDADNLVWKALQLLEKDYPGKIPALDIFLHKVIPMGAGLGGGSADGAFMLRLVNDYCSLGLTNRQLQQYALLLGSDCPFFVGNKPQYATGRGEQLADILVSLNAYSLQLVCPGVHVSTREAFQMLQPGKPVFDLKQLATVLVEQWTGLLKNDFEAPVFHRHPQLANIKEELMRQGALYASLTGSGSALYGIFPKGRKAGFTGGSIKVFYVE